jgi:hypothetical protein
VLRDDIVHLLYQIHTLKRDMTTALLEKANSEEIISEYLLRGLSRMKSISG